MIILENYKLSYIFQYFSFYCKLFLK